jgi:hypothetical protein
MDNQMLHFCFTINSSKAINWRIGLLWNKILGAGPSDCTVWGVDIDFLDAETVGLNPA